MHIAVEAQIVDTDDRGLGENDGAFEDRHLRPAAELRPPLHAEGPVEQEREADRYRNLNYLSVAPLRSRWAKPAVRLAPGEANAVCIRCTR